MPYAYLLMPHAYSKNEHIAFLEYAYRIIGGPPAARRALSPSALAVLAAPVPWARAAPHAHVRRPVLLHPTCLRRRMRG